MAHAKASPTTVALLIAMTRVEWGNDDYLETFMLTHVIVKASALAIEQWSIWRQWELAFHRGAAPSETHPAIPNQHPRYAELDATLRSRFSTQHSTARARGSSKMADIQSEVPPGALTGGSSGGQTCRLTVKATYTRRSP